MIAACRVLIIGGYGNFGSRLARLLYADPRFQLLIGGRSLEKAAAFTATLGGRAEAVLFNRDGDIPAQLRARAPTVVIDASGPFQIMGDDPYRVPQAAIALGIDYADLADSRAFVSGIVALDEAAKAADVFVLSGLSSLPALSFAAIEKLAGNFDEVHHIASGIAPSPHAGIGLNVVKAIASYGGKPVEVMQGGKSSAGYGLIDAENMVIAPPGCLPLRRRQFVLADAPDLDLLSRRFQGLQSSFTGAGTEPQILQRLLRLLARLVKLRLLPSLLPFAPLIHGASRRIAFGEHRGGMFVRLRGTGHDGNPLEASWHLTADGDDGPNIPVVGAEAVLRTLADGVRPPSGARPAAGAVALEAFDESFRRFAIRTGIRHVKPGDAGLPLYRRVLGSAWESLPPAVAAMHGLGSGEYVAAGRARVERGKGAIASLVAAIVGFPKAADDVAIRVRFRVEDGRETWTRDFGGKRFESHQSEARGGNAHLLAEDFGPFRVLMALIVDGARLRLVVRGWSFFGISLPLALAPGGDTFEEERDGRFRFHVEISGPLTGLIVRYTGWLEKSAG